MADEVGSAAEFDSLVAQAIATVEPTLVDDPEVEAEAEEGEAVVEPEAEVDAGTESKPDKDSDLGRIVAREVALANKERDIETKLTELKRLSTDSAGKVDINELRKMSETDVKGVLGKVGLDPEYLMDVLIAEKLGDKAPAALKEKLRDYNTKKEIKALRDERDTERRNAESSRYYSQVSQAAKDHVKGLDEKVAPVTSLVAKDDPDYVHALVLRELEDDAKAKVSRGDVDGELLSYGEAVTRIEKMFSRVAKVINAKTGETTSKKPALAPPVTRPKPPARPRDEIADLEELGLKTAMATLNRENAKRK